MGRYFENIYEIGRYFGLFSVTLLNDRYCVKIVTVTGICLNPSLLSFSPSLASKMTKISTIQVRKDESKHQEPMIIIFSIKISFPSLILLV